MNDNTQMTSAPGSSLLPDGTAVITTMHLVFIAIFAVVAILGILWGMKLKRQRKAAEQEVAADNAALSHPAEPSKPAPVSARTGAAATAPVAPPPPPVTPAPPPVSDAPVVGTPPDAAPVEPAAQQDEPIAASAPLEANPAIETAPPVPPSEPEPAPTPTATSANDAIPVTTLKGLGPKVAARLADLGITDVRQLAALDEAEAAKLDAELGSFSGRMTRDRWLDQARLLAAGDRAGYEAIFGKL